MTTHIICVAGPYDTFMPSVAPGDDQITVPFDIAGHPHTIQNTVGETFGAYGLMPTPSGTDVLRAAIAAYTADVRVARHSTFDRWTRDLVLHLPVHDVTAWSAGGPILARLLAFLTWDRWAVQVRPLPSTYHPAYSGAARQRTWRPDSVVCLFSGGLDSFIGAIDQIERVGSAVLVGHHSSGGGPTTIAQNRALTALRTVYAEARTPFLQVWLSPPKGPNRASEMTTRGRSILFLGLGVAIASRVPSAQLIVPENGFISLNVPLTSTRLGSFSTRTTHPHLIALIRQLLIAVGLDIKVSLPHRFQTKGELITQSARPDLVMEHVAATMSCAHPSAGRFGTERVANQHCGYCVPCIIRRAAITSVGSDPTGYMVNDVQQPLSARRRSDLRAFKLALDRFTHRPAQLADVLLAGPLPGSDDELGSYLAVFQRGMDEVRRFMLRYA